MSPAANAAIRAASIANMRLNQLAPESRTPDVVAAIAKIATATYAVLISEEPGAVGRLELAVSAADALIAAPKASGVHQLAFAALRAESAEERKCDEINARGDGWGRAEYDEVRPFEGARIEARRAWAAAGFPFDA